MYILLVGYPPFGGATEHAILRQVRKGQYTFTGPNWDAISDDAKHCIKQMLVMKASRRATATELLDEKWFKHASAVSDKVIDYLQCVCSLRLPACVYTLLTR
jgi:serine/threonine protein kinase